MKTLSKVCLMAFVALTSVINTVQAEIVDVYDFKMSLRIPRIYDNMSSLGYRKYQTQMIKGYLVLTYKDRTSQPEISIQSLYNKTHKISGQYITYDTEVDNEGMYFFPRMCYVGNNKTQKFTTPNLTFYMIAEPSYNIASEVDEDNSLYIMLSGIGNSIKLKGTNTIVAKSFRGNVTGTLGCGCKAYGHVSPTRTMTVDGPGDVTDVATTYGTWRATWKKTISRSNCILLHK